MEESLQSLVDEQALGSETECQDRYLRWRGDRWSDPASR